MENIRLNRLLVQREPVSVLQQGVSGTTGGRASPPGGAILRRRSMRAAAAASVDVNPVPTCSTSTNLQQRFSLQTDSIIADGKGWFFTL